MRFAAKSLPTPGGQLRQVLVEFGDQRGFVVAAVSPREKAVGGLFVEEFPTLLLVAGIDWEVVATVVQSGLLVSGSVADHQHLVGRPALRLARGEDFFLRADFLTADRSDVLSHTVLLPFFF